MEPLTAGGFTEVRREEGVRVRLEPLTAGVFTEVRREEGGRFVRRTGRGIAGFITGFR